MRPISELITQWDGIDNAGTGVHNPNATVWKDLAGNLDLALTANGTCYRKDLQGIIPRLTNEIYDGRKKDKKTMFKYEQRSVDIPKILSERLGRP